MQEGEPTISALGAQLDLIERTSQRLLLDDGPEETMLVAIFTDISTHLGAQSYYHYQPIAPRLLGLKSAAGIGNAELERFGAIKFGDLLCGQVAEKRTRIVIEDLHRRNTPDVSTPRGAAAQSYAGFPLVAAGELIGTVAFVSEKHTHFAPRAIQTIQSICDQIAITLHRRRLQAQIMEREARLEMAMEAGQAGAWEVCLATGEFKASDTAMRLHGLAPGTDMTHESALAVVHPDDQGNIQDALRRAVAGDAPYHVDLRIVREDGVRWIHSRATLHTDGVHPRLVGLAQDITAQKHAQQALRESEARLQAAKAAAHIGIHDYDIRSGAIAWDARVRELWGIGADEIVTYEMFMAGVHPDDRAATQAAVDRAFDPGGDGRYFATYRVIAKADGTMRWIEATGTTMFDHGAAVRLVGTVIDITERKAHEERIEFLLREVNHRAKNMLSLVQSVAMQTAAVNPHDFLSRFGARLRALAASQDRLIDANGQGASLANLVEGQLLHFKELFGERIVLDGPQVHVTAKSAQTIGLAIHELATNAAKYGAFSTAAGRVRVAWRIDGDAMFHLSCREEHGPPVTPPTHAGFGHRVAKTLVESALSAKVTFDYAPTGLAWRLACPLSAIGALSA
jgi:PAS domain S-box-containing protein